MSRRSWILFLVPVLIWSTTFYAITLQLDSPTTPAFAVAMRFAVASLLLFAWLAARGELQRMTRQSHLWAAVSGVCAYGISYVLTYVAEQDIPSGLVAIAFTLMVFMTPMLAKVAYGTPVTRSTWIGGSLGVAGVVLCFVPDIVAVEPSANFVLGMAAMVLAALASSIAAVCSIQLNKTDVPVTTYTAWAMGYGAVVTALYACLGQQQFRVDPRWSFWLAFAWLALAGTLVTFLCYLTLLKREGSARTMYISVLSPVGAVLVSVLVEGLRPQVLTWLGIVVAISGAWVTLRSKST